jgi:hypothetical protein
MSVLPSYHHQHHVNKDNHSACRSNSYSTSPFPTVNYNNPPRHSYSYQQQLQQSQQQSHDLHLEYSQRVPFQSTFSHDTSPSSSPYRRNIPTTSSSSKFVPTTRTQNTHESLKRSSAAYFNPHNWSSPDFNPTHHNILSMSNSYTQAYNSPYSTHSNDSNDDYEDAESYNSYHEHYPTGESSSISSVVSKYPLYSGEVRMPPAMDEYQRQVSIGMFDLNDPTVYISQTTNWQNESMAQTDLDLETTPEENVIDPNFDLRNVSFRTSLPDLSLPPLSKLHSNYFLLLSTFFSAFKEYLQSSLFMFLCSGVIFFCGYFCLSTFNIANLILTAISTHIFSLSMQRFLQIQMFKLQHSIVSLFLFWFLLLLVLFTCLFITQILIAQLQSYTDVLPPTTVIPITSRSSSSLYEVPKKPLTSTATHTTTIKLLRELNSQV